MLAHFHKTGFLLIDLLQLVLLLTKGYVTAISQLLEIASVSLSPVEFMQEFLSRYCCFKDTVQELDVSLFSFRTSSASSSQPSTTLTRRSTHITHDDPNFPFGGL